MQTNNETPEVQFYLAYYMDNGEMRTVVIPIRLKEVFMKTFKDNPTPSKTEIFKFLQDND